MRAYPDQELLGRARKELVFSLYVGHPHYERARELARQGLLREMGEAFVAAGRTYRQFGRGRDAQPS